jgi:hypothetical protein
MTARRKCRKHWYFITTFYCPVCASEEVFRERRYGRKPKWWGECHEIIDRWDGCNAF